MSFLRKDVKKKIAVNTETSKESPKEKHGKSYY